MSEIREGPRVWYERRVGRPPKDLAEIEEEQHIAAAEHYTAFLEANPHLRMARDLIVTYAEEKGGRVLEVIKLVHPGYWGIPEREPISSRLAAARVSDAEFSEIYAAMYDALKDRLPKPPAGGWRSPRLDY